jgi:hypothetical protein
MLRVNPVNAVEAAIARKQLCKRHLRGGCRDDRGNATIEEPTALGAVSRRNQFFLIYNLNQQSEFTFYKLML